ncbi:hypothetical protein ACGFYM_36270 [Streptomyces sp. NPDC048231]|uniref:hypothetical protein n=1 Tax=Streptomyces sp. NPDC048231 TaxID=3365519 RepID=UPI003710FB4F
MTADGFTLPDRWAHVAERLPASLEELSGPAIGPVELPRHLAWSGLTIFDLSDEQLLLGMYRVVLANGMHEDLIAYLNADILGRHWPRLRIALGRGVRSCWEQRFPQLMAAAAE